MSNMNRESLVKHAQELSRIASVDSLRVEAERPSLYLETLEAIAAGDEDPQGLARAILVLH